MKKVLSVVLAAAMVLGMSVSAFAAKSWGAGAGNDCVDTPAKALGFHNTMVVVHDASSGHNGVSEYGWDIVDVTSGGNKILPGSSNAARVGTEFTGFQPGDELYFTITQDVDGDGTYDFYYDDIDMHWSVNIKTNDYVKSAKFYSPEVGDDCPWIAGGFDKTYRYVKVDIVDDFDDIDSTNVNFYMYIADNATQQTSEKAIVKYSFDNVVEKYVDFYFTNDADHAAKWIVAEDKKGTAVFDFEDDVYFTVKMVSDEEVILNLSQAYNKTIDKEYNEYDADLEFYNFKGSNDSFIKTGKLFIPSAKDNKFIYEYVDGELVAAETEYDSAYKVGNAGSSKKGYVIETKELGYYVVADEELVVAEEPAEEPAATTEPAKENPGTGASDFVGAAVALAVVSVAAAGALAFKK